MSYYMTLSSHVQRGEFPDNGPSDFRVRLPENRVWDNTWEVGLSGVSLPMLPSESNVHPEGLIIHSSDTGTHSTAWKTNGLLCMYTFESKGAGSGTTHRRGYVSLNMIGPSATGVEFVKKITDMVEQKIQMQIPVGESYVNQTVSSATVRRRRAPKFKWDGDDLILDNSETWLGLKWMYFGFLVELGLNMNWIVDSGSSVDYEKGDNMLIEAKDATSAKPNYMIDGFNDGGDDGTANFPHNASSPNYFLAGKPFTATTESLADTDGALFLVFSDYFNWRFVRLNEAFDKFRTKAALQTVERPLYLMVDLIETEWVDGAYDELLRTVPYKKGEVWWEPRRVQYHSHRGADVEIFRVRVSELNGKPVTFGEGHTRVCLHFRRRHHGTARTH